MAESDDIGNVKKARLTRRFKLQIPAFYFVDILASSLQYLSHLRHARCTLMTNNTWHVFVTVGTTKFDALVSTVLSHNFLTQLPALLPVKAGKSKVKLTIQYGNSSIADILTTSSLASVDDGSELQPEPGLRVIGGRRVYQNKADLPELDPGKTGTLKGLRLRMPQHNGAERSTVADTPQTSFFSGSTLEATTPEGVDILLFPFTSSLKEYLEASDLVVSHAGEFHPRWRVSSEPVD